MARLIYFMPCSLDGYISDHDYEWSKPDEEVMAFINDLLRPIGTYLYGRKVYDVMTVWQTPDALPDQSPTNLDFAHLWQAADKIVYSRSLDGVSTPRTRLEREFSVGGIRALKADLPHDLTVGGPTLAAQAIHAGLVDAYHFLVLPMILGAGIRILPPNVTLKLHLVSERRFPNGTVHLHYQPYP